MTTRNKNRLLGFAIGANIAAAISTFYTGYNSAMLTTHITLTIVLVTSIQKDEY